MNHLNNRREFISFLGIAFVASCAGVGADDNKEFIDAFAELEKSSGGKLGICVFNTNSGKYIGHRLEERFAMCSTFKLPLAAIVLHEINAGRLDKNLLIPLDAKGLYVYSPIVEEALKTGKISIIDAAKAAQISSDNIAANAILNHLGGPQIFNAKMREMGDEITNLGRIEPMMNVVKPGETSDTTTPLAMAYTLQKIVSKEYLGDDNYEILTGWMKETQTGLKRLRAGLPIDWDVGDKTGTGISKGLANKYNDVAIAITPKKQRVIITSYFEADNYYDDMRDEDQQILKRAAEIAARFIAK